MYDDPNTSVWIWPVVFKTTVARESTRWLSSKFSVPPTISRFGEYVLKNKSIAALGAAVRCPLACKVLLKALAANESRLAVSQENVFSITY